MRKALLLLPLLLVLGCPAVEKTAYNTVIAAKAFTDKVKSQHPECNTGNASALCATLIKAVAAKDTLIDSVEIYCAGPSFNGGGACQPPAKGTPAYIQATNKLNAALVSYEQLEKDLKGVLK
jgi:hypothetical protein